MQGTSSRCVCGERLGEGVLSLAQPRAAAYWRLAGPMLVVVQRVVSSVGVMGGLIQDDVHMLDLALPK